MNEQATGRLLTIEPILNLLKTEAGIHLPDSYREAHVQCGWVRSIGRDCQENFSIGDLVVFIGWQEIGIPKRAYAPWDENLYTLHEEDIELIIEDW